MRLLQVFSHDGAASARVSARHRHLTWGGREEPNYIVIAAALSLVKAAPAPAWPRPGARVADGPRQLHLRPDRLPSRAEWHGPGRGEESSSP